MNKIEYLRSPFSANWYHENHFSYILDSLRLWLFHNHLNSWAPKGRFWIGFRDLEKRQAFKHDCKYKQKQVYTLAVLWNDFE